jgi:hypothetical protein
MSIQFSSHTGYKSSSDDKTKEGCVIRGTSFLKELKAALGAHRTNKFNSRLGHKK